MTNLPQYTKNKMKGNIGEALVQYLLSSFCLVHKIDGSNDVGNDFICELIKENYPTNLLFYVQVKFTARSPRIRKETIEYWKGSPIPVYVIWVKGDPPNSFTNNDSFDSDKSEKLYKRMTPFIHNPGKHKNEKFKKFEEKDFKRDLIVDYARTQYQKGFLPIIEPRDFLTLDEKLVLRLPKYQLPVRDVIPEYKDKILKRSWIQPFVVSKLLSESNQDHESLQIAYYLIEAAQKLFMRSEDNNKIEFAHTIDEQKTVIQEKLSTTQE